jgi:hypothetical protein
MFKIKVRRLKNSDNLMFHKGLVMNRKEGKVFLD